MTRGADQDFEKLGIDRHSDLQNAPRNYTKTHPGRPYSPGAFCGTIDSMVLAHLLIACSLAGSAGPADGLRSGRATSVAAPAAQAQRQAKATGGVEGDAYYHFVLGRHRESEGDVDAAIKAHQQAAALDPKSAEIRAELAGLYARQDRALEAIDWAEAALELEAGNGEANRVLGIVYASLAHLEDDRAGDAEALANAKKAVAHLEATRQRAISPDAGVELMLGRLYLRTGDIAQAIATLHRLRELEPERREPIAWLAQAYQQAGRPDDAADVLEKAVGEHPEFYPVLAELYQHQQRWPDAARAFERALARNPQSGDLKRHLAVSLLSGGGPAEAGRAVALLREVQQQTPGDSQVLYLLAQAQRMAGSLDEAEATAKQLAGLSPATLTGPYVLAQIYDQKQQYRRVVETLAPVLARQDAGQDKGDLVPLVLALASAYEELGEFDRALETYGRARVLQPEHPNLDLYELATLVSARRFPEALRRSEALLAKGEEDPRVVRLRAEALRGAGRADEGVKLLKEALGRHPDDVSAYLALSEMHATTGHYDAAVALLGQAATKFPSDLTVRFQLGAVLERQGRLAEAERAFRDVLRTDPLFAPALNYLGYMLADRGERLDESIGFIKRALQVEPHNGAYLDSLGWAYFKANRLDLAEEPLRKAAEQRVRDSAVQDHYGDLLFRLGRYTEAQAAWRRALDGDGEQINRADIDRKIRSANQKAPKQ